MPSVRVTARPLGVVYTPPPLARAMVANLVAPLVERAETNALLKLRICDPAAGEGVFLRTVVEQLGDHVVRAWNAEGTRYRDEPRERDALTGERTIFAEARAQVAQRCIVGADTDSPALTVADQALRELAHINDGSASCARLFCADALSFDWRAALPDVFAAERGGFDALVANPPYIRQELLTNKEGLRAFSTYDGVADYYVYFIELAHRLLRPGGRYSIVVPSKWMTAEYGRPLRTFLAASNSVDTIVDLSSLSTFADAEAFPCVITGTIGGLAGRPVFAVRASGAQSIEVGLSQVPSNLHVKTLSASSSQDVPAGTSSNPHVGNDAGEARTKLQVETSGPGGSHVVPARTSSNPHVGNDTGEARTNLHVEMASAVHANAAHDRALWTAAPWHITTPSDRGLLTRIERDYPTLGEIVGTRWSRGVVTGLNDAFVIDRGTRDALIAADSSSREWIRPFVRGRDVRAYRVAPTERWLLLVDRGTKLVELPRPIIEHLSGFRVRLEPRPADSAGASSAWPGRKAGAYAWFQLQDPVVPLAKSHSPRLFYQDIQTAPLCALDLAGEIVPDTTVWILPSADLVLLAILNSPVYRWISRRRFPPALNGAVRPKLQYMQSLPVPPVSDELRREISSLVEQKLSPACETSSLDRYLAELVCVAYELSRAERALVA